MYRFKVGYMRESKKVEVLIIAKDSTDALLKLGITQKEFLSLELIEVLE